MEFIEIIKVILLGIVEGVTEWLPISSTGHMILLDEFISLNVSENFMDLFLVVIQLGAICAVPVLFFNKLNPFSLKKTKQERTNTWVLWTKVAFGVMPAGFIGLLVDDIFEKYLYNYVVVAATLILYGVAFVWVESRRKSNDIMRVISVNDITYRDALTIGAFQVLSLIPGTSRSGSTILGGILTGVSRTASAEFSFFMAIPIMVAASGLKIFKFILDGFTATTDEIILLIIGMVVSFIVSLASIKFLMDFVKRHSFKPFGIYRIILGFVVVVYFLIKIAVLS